MKALFLSLLFIAAVGLAPLASAHHSFAVFDFSSQIPFDGTVKTLKFRNPHIAMTLSVMDESGEEQIVEFIQGAPANMLVRNGLRPAMIKVGTHITAVGSPLISDQNKFFLRLIVLESGEEF